MHFLFLSLCGGNILVIKGVFRIKNTACRNAGGIFMYNFAGFF